MILPPQVIRREGAVQRAVELRYCAAIDGERLVLGEPLDGAVEVRAVPDDGPADADAPLVAPVVRLAEPDRPDRV